MRIAASLLFTAAMAYKEPTVEDFYNHIMSQGLTYSSAAEYEVRMQNFFANDRDIQAFNAIPGTLSKHAHNKFSTWSAAERKAYNTYKPEVVTGYERYHQPTAAVYGATAPASSGVTWTINWVTEGAVTSVKNQGNCGSCWAFTSTAILESAYQISTGVLMNLSEQQVVSCSINDGEGGCNGGNIPDAMNYATTYPLVPLTDYPYTSGNTGQTGTCMYDPNQGVVSPTSKVRVTPQNVPDIKDAVQQQPCGIVIDASSSYFTSYTSGILTNNAECGTTIDHAVTIVGWGQENGTEFWYVKNSWGTWWGDEGYVKFAIVDGIGTCGCQTQIVYPVMPTA